MKLHLHKALKLKFKIGLDRVVGDARGIYVGDSHKSLYALEPDDYRVRWEMPAKGFEPSALAGDVLVLAGDGAQGLRGLDTQTGETRWTSLASTRVWRCDPWRGGLLRAAVGDREIEVHSVDPASGEVVETIRLEGWGVFLGDWHALLTYGEHAGRCVDLRDRSVAWERAVFDVAADAAGVAPPSDTYGQAAFHPPDAVVVQRGRGLAALRLTSGETLWTASLPVDTVGHVAADLGCVVASTRQEMIALDIESGRIKWVRPHAGPSPAGDAMAPPRQRFRGHLVSHEADGLHLVDATSGVTLATAAGRTFTAFTEVGDRLVALRWDGRVNVFGLDRGLVPPKPPKAIAEPKVFRARRGDLAFVETARVKLPGLRFYSQAIPTRDAITVSDPDTGVAHVAREGWRVLWQKPAGAPEIAWAAGGVLLAPQARRGRVTAFRATDGETLWEAASQRGQAWPLDERRVVVAPAGAKALEERDVETGEVLRTLDRPLPRVLCAAGERIVLASTRQPIDEQDAIRKLGDEPGIDQGVVEAIMSGDEAAAATLSEPTAGRFAVVDVEDGRTIWNRDLEPELKEMSGLEGALRLQVVGADADWFLLWHWTQRAQGSVLWGVSTVTGAVAWQARLQARGEAHFLGGRVWVRADSPVFECVDVATGRVLLRPSITGDDRPAGHYGARLVSSKMRYLDFYHPHEDAQRVPLPNGAQIVLGEPPELVLVEGGRLRVLRERTLD